MKAITPAQVNGAIARLPRQSNTSIEQVLVNACRLDIKAPVEACQYELRARGSLILTTAEAERTSAISTKVAGKALSEVIELAFNDVPAKPEEVLILRWISEHPGVSHAEIGVVYGRRDLSLVIGHLIYYRFGYFRPMLFSPIQSDFLLERDKTSGKMCYTLRPEALTAFRSSCILSGCALAGSVP